MIQQTNRSDDGDVVWAGTTLMIYNHIDTGAVPRLFACKHWSAQYSVYSLELVQ